MLLVCCQSIVHTWMHEESSPIDPGLGLGLHSTTPAIGHASAHALLTRGRRARDLYENLRAHTQLIGEVDT
jgi:hypothetical protein